MDASVEGLVRWSLDRGSKGFEKAPRVGLMDGESLAVPFAGPVPENHRDVLVSLVDDVDPVRGCLVWRELAQGDGIILGLHPDLRRF